MSTTGLTPKQLDDIRKRLHAEHLGRLHELYRNEAKAFYILTDGVLTDENLDRYAAAKTAIANELLNHGEKAEAVRQQISERLTATVGAIQLVEEALQQDFESGMARDHWLHDARIWYDEYRARLAQWHETNQQLEIKP